MCRNRPRLAVLADQFDELSEHRYAVSTRPGYRTALNSYCRFAERFGLDAPPAAYVDDPTIWVGWLLYLRKTGTVKYESARKYFSAFKSQLETAGIDLPLYKMPLLQAMRKAWKRSEHPPAKKVPITLEDVNSLIGSDEERKHPVFVAITRFGFDTLARLSEIGDAKWANVTERKEFVSIHLDRTKTDPFGRDHQSLTLSLDTWREVKKLIPVKSRGRIFGIFAHRI